MIWCFIRIQLIWFACLRNFYFGVGAADSCGPSGPNLFDLSVQIIQQLDPGFNRKDYGIQNFRKSLKIRDTNWNPIVNRFGFLIFVGALRIIVDPPDVVLQEVYLNWF
jgi:hypothetical protein